jgi:hypothetical protein
MIVADARGKGANYPLVLQVRQGADRGQNDRGKATIPMVDILD